MSNLTAVPFADAAIAEFKAVETLDDGALIIEGFAATYDVDREDEAFLDGCFTRSLKAFLAGNAPLLWHHKMSEPPIGR